MECVASPNKVSIASLIFVHLFQIDIDDKLLHRCRNLVKPLLVDYVTPSPKPLTVEVWRGNIAVPHECLEGADAIIGIEIIEHLHQSVLDEVPQNVFGFIRPKLAFFSTPNAEYNVLFDGLLENGFRHDDHKFEWTRAQFEEWANSICVRYPDYCVKYFGIGPPPPGSEGIGFVSQLAVFVRKDFLNSLPDQPSTVDTVKPDEPQLGESSKMKCWFDPETCEIMAEPPQQVAPIGEVDALPDRAVEGFSHGAHDGPVDDGWQLEEELNLDLDNGSSDGAQGDDDGAAFDMHIAEEEIRANRVRNDSGNFEEDENNVARDGEYWMIHRDEYPLAPPDDRTAEQRVRDEALYQLRRLRNCGEEFYHANQDQHLIPLHVVRDCIVVVQTTIEQLRRIISNEGYIISADDTVCLPVEYSSDEDDVDYFAEYDVDVQGWDDEDVGNVVPDRAVASLSLAEDFTTWD